MGHLQRLLRGVEANEAGIAALNRELAVMERTLQAMATDIQSMGGSAEGGVHQTQGEVRIGGPKGAKMDKDGFSIHARITGDAERAVDRYDILSNLQSIPTDTQIALFSLFGIQGDEDAGDFDFNSMIAQARGLRPAFRPNNRLVLPDAQFILRAIYGIRTQQTGIILHTFDKGHYDKTPFIGLPANSNLLLMTKDGIDFNEQQENIAIVLHGESGELLRTEPKLSLVRYKRVGTLAAILDLKTDNVVVDNTSNFTTLYEFFIPANVLGTKNMVEASVIGTERNTTGTTRTVQFRVNWGGVEYTTGTKSLPNGTNERMAPLRLYIAGDGATNAQKLILDYRNTIAIFVRNETPAVDSTQDQKVVIQVKFQVAATGLRYDKVFAWARWYDNVNSEEKLIQPREDLVVNDFATVEIE